MRKLEPAAAIAKTAARTLERSPRRCSEAAQRDEGDEGGGDRQRLGRRVDRAEGSGGDVEDRRREEGRRNRRAVALDPARQRERERDEAEQAAGVEDDRGHAARARRQAELTRRPDPERLQRRDLPGQVPEPALVGPIRMQRAEIDEVGEAPHLGQHQQHERPDPDADPDQRTAASTARRSDAVATAKQLDRAPDHRHPAQPGEARGTSRRT